MATCRKGIIAGIWSAVAVLEGIRSALGALLREQQKMNSALETIQGDLQDMRFNVQQMEDRTSPPIPDWD